MASLPMVEELAWLIKDNLPSKHVVLSAEDLFVEFLESEGSKGNILMLEPMVSYHRMLLHRLADIFRLAHESIGEGDGRRLVVERSESSLVPDVLVSDILECNDGKEPVSSSSAPQLLRRGVNQPGSYKCQIQVPQITFEERQAAYLAARQRIFSGDCQTSVESIQAARPRSVPVVARRMIAHALGKQVLANTISRVAQGSEPANDKEAIEIAKADSTLMSFGSSATNEHALGRLTIATSESSTCSQAKVPTPSSGTHDIDVRESPARDLHEQHLVLAEDASKISDFSPANAAKRMFAQALGFDPSNSSCRVSSRHLESETLEGGSPVEGVKEVCKLAPAQRSKWQNLSSKEQTYSLQNQPKQALVSKSGLQANQSRAAQRMLVQALGLQGSSFATDKMGKPMNRGVCL